MPSETSKQGAPSLGSTVLVAALLTVTGCAVNPATGQRQFILISESEEIQMGRDADGPITESLGLYDSDELQEVVRNIGNELASRSERAQVAWSFQLVADPVVNAFALPGGFIFVTRGIMAALNSEAELAGVLGHEIGHVTARHSASQMSRQQLQQIGTQVPPFTECADRHCGDAYSEEQPGSTPEISHRGIPALLHPVRAADP